MKVFKFIQAIFHDIIQSFLDSDLFIFLKLMSLVLLIILMQFAIMYAGVFVAYDLLNNMTIFWIYIILLGTLELCCIHAQKTPIRLFKDVKIYLINKWKEV